jgi:branched-chain amino acid transport system permease protein
MRKAMPYLMAAAAAAAVLAFSHFSEGMNPYLLQILVYMGVNVMLAASLNLINGFAGQFSLGHAGFMAIGAYTAAAFTYYLGGYDGTAGEASGLMKAFGHAGIPPSVASPFVFLAALLLGGIAAAAAGLLVGLPTLRLRGDYLAIATLGFGEIVRIVISQIEAVGGPRGFSGIPKLTSVAWVAAWVALTLICLRNLLASSHGRAFVSVREDEVAAAAVGVDTTRYKVLAFSIGAFFAGIAGGLFGHYLMYLHPNSFTFIKSIEIVVMVVLGGMGSLVGSAAAAVILTVLPEVLRTFNGALAVGYCFAISIAVARPLGRPGAARALGLLAMSTTGLGALLTLGAGTGGTSELGWMLGLGVAAACAALISCWVARGRARMLGTVGVGVAALGFGLLLVGPNMLPGPLLAAKGWVEANVSQLRLVIYAGILVGLMLARPRGLLGGRELTWRVVRSFVRSATARTSRKSHSGLAAT